MKLSQSFAMALGAEQSRFGQDPTAIRRQPSVRLSKHFHRFGRSDVRLSDYSSLRKLMRAARRGKLPEERLLIIDTAMENAQRRPHIYANRS